MNKKWEVGPMGNSVLDCDGFYVSYRENTADFGSMLAGDDNGAGETALCHDGEYDVLNGDFRQDYENLVGKGLDACKKFYNGEKEEFVSCWSS